MIDLSEDNDEEDIRASEEYEENIDQKESKDSVNKRVIEALQTVPWNAFETSVLKNSEQNVEIEDKKPRKPKVLLQRRASVSCNTPPNLAFFEMLQHFLDFFATRFCNIFIL